MNDDHAVFIDVVESTDEWADQRGAGLRRHESLIRREDQGAVCLDPLGGEAADCLKAGRSESDLYDDVWSDLREGETLLDHAVGIITDDFCRYWALGEAADLLEDLLVRAANLRVERRVRGHAVNDAPLNASLDLFNVSGVQEELHSAPSMLNGLARLCAITRLIRCCAVPPS